MTKKSRVVLALVVAAAENACVDAPVLDNREQTVSRGTLPPPGPTTIDTPVGLALDIEDGVPVPLQVRKNQRFYINQIDMRAHLLAATDEGVAGLATAGDFAGLDWSDTELVDQSFGNLPNPDGTFTRRRMYRQSRWMDRPSLFLIEQLDANGYRRGAPLVVNTGTEHDNFFARRLRAIQWTNDCASKTNCSTATHFEEEALVELRYANGPQPSFQFDSKTTQLRVTWTANRHRVYTIPVQQVVNPEWDYGLGIDLAVTTTPAVNGTYAPGQVLDVKFTLRDGSGKPLHPPGQLPTFLDYLVGNNPAGIDYWNVNERVMTYYRRKHREKQMLVSIDGPMQDTTTVRDTLDFFGEILRTTDGSIVTATPAVQGFFAEAASVPGWQTLAGLYPIDNPVSDAVQFTLPPDARPGTYKITMKARRSYLGEELPRATVITIQVGTPQPTVSALETGPCTSCHSGGSDLTRVGHALSADQRDTCTSCHVPLPFEPEGPVYVRTHFIHSRTDRLKASPAECNLCHTSSTGIQRTSKSACLSCHKSYPDDHVATYGAVADMYIGGTPEDSFQQCTTSCHRAHPLSGL